MEEIQTDRQLAMSHDKLQERETRATQAQIGKLPLKMRGVLGIDVAAIRQTAHGLNPEGREGCFRKLFYWRLCSSPMGRCFSPGSGDKSKRVIPVESGGWRTIPAVCNWTEPSSRFEASGRASLTRRDLLSAPTRYGQEPQAWTWSWPLDSGHAGRPVGVSSP